jgi:hypothetical protein
VVAASRSSGFWLFASLPNAMRTIAYISEAESTTVMPQLLKFLTTSGLKIISQLSTGAFGMAAFTLSTL